MCFANDNCEVEGRRKAAGRLCTACGYVTARCSNCGNEWSYEHASVVGLDDCPECGRH